MNNKIIYSMRVMLQLVERGYIPIANMPNPKNPKYQCWVFKMEGDIQKALDEILGGEQNGR